jgi:hypothetical protein
LAFAGSGNDLWRAHFEADRGRIFFEQREEPMNHRGLVSLDAGAHLDKGAGELPIRLVVGPWGTHETQKGRITFNETTVRELPIRQRLAQFDRIALDFNHNTVPGSESYRGEPAPVAAHGVPSVVAGEGIILSELEWTPDGEAAVRGRYYIDLSPTIELNAAGEAIFIHSAALCRQGAIPGLSLFSADPLGDRGLSEPHLRLLLTTALYLQHDAHDDDILDSIQRAAGMSAYRDAQDASGKLSVLSATIAVMAASGGPSERTRNIARTLLRNPDTLLEESTARWMGVSPEAWRKYK